ncbi:MAG: helix-turn-helix domain-containing protein [Chromatiales bacterium]|nr:helix-turn-helix domain-containing protein [Chromatiales bacterium]
MEEENINEMTKPGQYLAYEREKQGLEIENISNELHLSVNIIRALEEDAYDQLPEMVYIRGYIRSYCRLLNKDATPVLEMLSANLPMEEDYLHADLSLSSPSDEYRQRLIMIVGSVAVITIFLILIMIWWQEKQPMQEPESAEPLVQNTDIDDSNISNITTIKQETVSPADTPDPPSQVLAPVEIDIKKAMPEDQMPNGLATEDMQIPDEVNQNITENEDFMDDMPQVVTLVVMSTDESWARIRDGSGKLIVHRILPTGYNKIFKAKMPLNFELGNASRVSIMIGGKDYDFSSYIRDSNTASFQVTELP